MPTLNWKSTELIKMTKYFEAALACRTAQIYFIQAVLKLILMHFSKCVKRILKVEVHRYKSLPRPRLNGFTVWLIKTTFVYLARWPSNQFSRAIAIAYHENYRLCSRKGKHQKNLCAFAPLSAEQLWPQLSEHRISLTRWPRTQNLLISLKIQPALYTCLSAPLPSAALRCYGSALPTKEDILQKEKSIAKMLRAFCMRPDKYSWCNCLLKSCSLSKF